MGRVSKWLTAAVILLMVTGFDWPWDKWDGWFYRRGNTFSPIHGGPFKTKRECLDWAEKQVTSFSDDFECGKNCKPSETGTYNICEVTVDG